MRRNQKLRRRQHTNFYINLKNRINLMLTALLVIILITIFIFNCHFHKIAVMKENLENEYQSFIDLNDSISFSIEKIILFSSATAIGSEVNYSYVNLNISQYCDIALYMSKTETTISSLYIDNINITKPSVGTAYLYKKNVEDLGDVSFKSENIITESMYFNIINSDSEINYENYELYNDCSTPISLGFYNENVKENHIVSLDDFKLDGTLLKDSAIPLCDLASNISFTLNIITANNEHYICNVSLDIPLENQDGTLYEQGSISQTITSENINTFIRIK